MEKLIRYLNEMVQSGLIAGYSLGGATALIYYFEPFQTQDIDVFVILDQNSENNVLVNLSPIYSFLSSKGVEAKSEYLIIEGIPVQFLVPYNSLVSEAVAQAIEVSFRSVTVPIPPLEYLMAIMVQTGRPKDRARLEELLKNESLYNQSAFEELISKFHLIEKYSKIQEWIKN